MLSDIIADFIRYLFLRNIRAIDITLERTLKPQSFTNYTE